MREITLIRCWMCDQAVEVKSGLIVWHTRQSGIVCSGSGDRAAFVSQYYATQPHERGHDGTVHEPRADVQKRT